MCCVAGRVVVHRVVARRLAGDPRYSATRQRRLRVRRRQRRGINERRRTTRRRMSVTSLSLSLSLSLSVSVSGVLLLAGVVTITTLLHAACPSVRLSVTSWY